MAFRWRGGCCSCPCLACLGHQSISFVACSRRRRRRSNSSFRCLVFLFGRNDLDTFLGSGRTSPAAGAGRSAWCGGQPAAKSLDGPALADKPVVTADDGGPGRRRRLAFLGDTAATFLDGATLAWLGRALVEAAFDGTAAFERRVGPPFSKTDGVSAVPAAVAHRPKASVSARLADRARRRRLPAPLADPGLDGAVAAARSNRSEGALARRARELNLDVGRAHLVQGRILWAAHLAQRGRLHVHLESHEQAVIADESALDAALVDGAARNALLHQEQQRRCSEHVAPPEAVPVKYLQRQAENAKAILKPSRRQLEPLEQGPVLLGLCACFRSLGEDCWRGDATGLPA